MSSDTKFDPFTTLKTNPLVAQILTAIRCLLGWHDSASILAVFRELNIPYPTLYA
jgi:hypothetical protein